MEEADPEAAQALLEKRCQRCHSGTRIYAADDDRLGWSRRLERMFSHGAVLTERERDVIAIYLSSRR